MLVNPAILYALTWIFVLGLYSFGLSDVLEPLAGNTIVLVIGTSMTFIFGWILESLPYRGRRASSKIDMAPLAATICSRRVGARVRSLWIFFFVMLVFEIAIGGGAPMLGTLGIGPEILYTDFGLPGLHGLVNSVFYVASVLTFTRALLLSSPHVPWLILATMMYPLLGMSRQVMISLCVQYLFVYISVRRPSPATVVRVCLLFVAIFLAFGYLGDLRSSREAIIGWLAPDLDYPDWLPSAFLWFYLYVSTPLNNVNLNIGIAPNLFPLETAGTLIPSFAREGFMNAFGGPRQWDLVTDTFNVSSLLQSLLTDFGVVGSILFTLLCGIAFSHLLRRAHRSPRAFFAVIVLLHGITLSFFANLLFHLVFLCEIALLVWVVSRRRRR